MRLGGYPVRLRRHPAEELRDPKDVRIDGERRPPETEQEDARRGLGADAVVGDELPHRLLVRRDLALPAARAALGDAGEVLRLWERPTPAVVLGSGGSVAIDVNVAACEADGVPILRRASGGGTVVLGPGCLCFSLVLACDREPGLDQIRFSNQYVLGRVVHALAPVVTAAVVLGLE